MYFILDSTESGQIIKRALKKSGFKALVAKTNQQAIKHLDEHLSSVECVVVDLYLRHNSSLEFLYEMRSYKDMSSIPIVIYSSQHVPVRVTKSLDWKLLGISRVFYKTKHSITDVCEFVLSRKAEVV